MELKLIPAGEFMMGSPMDEKDRESDELQHRVRITQPFYFGVYEVTQGEYENIMGESPWAGKPGVKEGADYAAGHIRWSEAVEFCKTLSAKEGRTYRLPSEAEWEYACRAGTTTLCSFSDSDTNLGDYAWCYNNAYKIGEIHTHQVGRKHPNAWGLYDMHGNAFEGCSDWYDSDYYEDSPIDDPVGPPIGSGYVYRGGSLGTGMGSCRSASRQYFLPKYRDVGLGFRVVLELVEPVEVTEEVSTGVDEPTDAIHEDSTPYTVPDISAPCHIDCTDRQCDSGGNRSNPYSPCFG